MGHRSTLALGFVMTATFSVIFAYVETLPGLQASSWLFSFWSSISWSSLFFMAPLSFKTNVRSTAMGTLGLAGRLAQGVTPYIMTYLLVAQTPESVHIPFLLIAGLNCGAFFATFLLRKSDLEIFQSM